MRITGRYPYTLRDLLASSHRMSAVQSGNLCSLKLRGAAEAPLPAEVGEGSHAVALPIEARPAITHGELRQRVLRKQPPCPPLPFTEREPQEEEQLAAGRQ